MVELFVCLLVERPTENNTQIRRTWGPSSLQKKDKIQHHQMMSPATTHGWVRWSRSAPNLNKTLSCIGDQSVIRAFTDLGQYSLSLWLFTISLDHVAFTTYIDAVC